MANLYEAFLELEPRRRWLGVILVISGLFLSAVIGAGFDTFLSRPRPKIELASVQFKGSLQANSKLVVPPSLQKSYADAPYALEDFKAQITLEILDSLLVEVKDYNAILPTARDALQKVTRELEQSPLDANKDTLRRKLLLIWTEPQGNVLEVTLRSVLTKQERLQRFSSDPKLQHYAKHPTNSPWNSPETATVWLAAGHSYRLSDETVLATDDTRTRASKLAVSMYRRLWIHLDRDLMLELLKETDASLQEIMTKSNEFEKALATFRATSNPDRIEATVIVSNLGKTPLIVRTSGLLRLAAGNDHVDVPVAALVDRSLQEHGVVAIAGGATQTYYFYSILTADELSQKFYKGNLTAIYNSEILSCRFGGLRVSADSDDSPIVTTKQPRFGSKVREANKKRLEDQLSR